MNRFTRTLTLAAALACGTLTPLAHAADTTVLQATPPVITARQTYGAKLTYHFDAAPMKVDSAIHMTILNDKNQPVGGGIAQPPSTLTWSGKIDLTRWVGTPDAPPAYGKTGEPLPDGTYTVWIKLDAPMLPGPGVKEDKQFGYQVATVKLDHNAPLPQLPKPTLDLKGYHKTFEDNFKDLSISAAGPCGTAPGETRWMAHTPSHGDFGDARFMDPKPGFPFSNENGILNIHVKKTPEGWQGGLLSSVDYHGHGYSQKLGYFEMRAKLAKGTGTWPAFWLLSQPDVDHPENKDVIGCEVDVLEQYGHWPNVLNTTTHQWPHNNKTPHTATFEGIVVPGMTDGFHNYGVLITDSTLTYFYDGTELRHEPTPNAAKVPMYILVNFTLGPGWPTDKTPKDMSMLVEYVRTYAKD